MSLCCFFLRYFQTLSNWNQNYQSRPWNLKANLWKKKKKRVFSTVEVVEHTSWCILVLFNRFSFSVCFLLSESKHHLTRYEENMINCSECSIYNINDTQEETFVLAEGGHYINTCAHSDSVVLPLKHDNHVHQSIRMDSFYFINKK